MDLISAKSAPALFALRIAASTVCKNKTKSYLSDSVTDHEIRRRAGGHRALLRSLTESAQVLSLSACGVKGRKRALKARLQMSGGEKSSGFLPDSTCTQTEEVGRL